MIVENPNQCMQIHIEQEGQNTQMESKNNNKYIHHIYILKIT